MKFDLHFPAMPVMINLKHTEQMIESPGKVRLAWDYSVLSFHTGEELFSP